MVVVLMSAAPADAQSTRAETIAEAQAEKARRLATEGPSGTERFIVFASKPRTSAFYPWLGKAYRGSGLAVGLGVDRRLPGGGVVAIHGGGNQRRSWVVGAEVRLRALDEPKQLRMIASEARGNELAFYGIGGLTPSTNRTLYDLRIRQALLEGSAPLAAGLALTATAGYEGVATIDAPAAVNLTTRINYLRLGTGLLADWRPHPRYATKGGFVRINWTRRTAKDDQRASFDTVETEAAQLIPLVNEQFTLALRAMATTTRTTEGHTVPFIFLPHAGSGDTLRGFANNRFKDRSRLILSAEYRWRASRVIDMAIFADHGAVGPALRDLRRDDFRTTWGAGLRFHTPVATVFRFDVARSREGTRLVFSTSQPF